MAKYISICLLVCIAAAVIEQSYGAANIIDIYRKEVFTYAVEKSKKPVVVFYYSSTKCLACKWSIKPMLEKMARRKSDSIYLAIVDFDKVPELEEMHAIDQIPTTRLMYKGDVLDSVEGLSWSQLVPLVNKASKVVDQQ